MSSDLGGELRELLAQIGNKVGGWGRELLLMIPNFIAATLVIIVAWLLSKATGRVVCRLVGRVANKALTSLVYKITRVATVILGGLIALHILELEQAATTFLAGAGILGIAIGFAFQDLSANFIAGVAIAVRRPIKIGDIVEAKDIFGRVEAIHLRHTRMKQPDGKVMIVPNRRLFEDPLVNYSRLGKLRVTLGCGVHYSSDLEEVRDAVLDAVDDVDHLPEDPVEVLFDEFDNSSINLLVRFWVDFDSPGDLRRARSAAMMRIKKAFDERGIVIPFPIRTLQLSSDTQRVVGDLTARQSDQSREEREAA